MNEEIKEILDDLKNINNYDYSEICDNENNIIEKEYDIYLSKNKIDLLLDYITNLQEENERLTAESTQWEERTYCWQDRAEDLEIIIDKAIEVIDLIKPELWNISNKMTYRLIDVKNILNGGDDND